MNQAFLLALFLWVFTLQSRAQTLRLQGIDSLKGISLRGVWQCSDKVFWASGSKGHVYRCTNGTKGQWMQVKGYEQADFRAIVAYSASTAIIMSITKPAALLRTTNGGESWAAVFTDTNAHAFFDALAVNGAEVSLLGDPLDGRMYQAHSQDSGKHWRVLNNDQRIQVNSGEAAFASSNGNMAFTRNGHLLVATGGIQSALYAPPLGLRLCNPLMQGQESTGINAIAASGRQVLVAGGSFESPKRADSSLALATLSGSSVKMRAVARALPSAGYNSSVQWATKKWFLTTGFGHLSLHSTKLGVLQTVSPGFHALSRFVQNQCLAVGSNGRIYRINIE